MIDEVQENAARHHLLDGKVILHQDAGGAHRAGLDAVMLAASVSMKARHVVDLGAGVGSAGLCVAARLPNVRITLIENNPATLILARKTLEDTDNAGFSSRVTLLDADVTLRGKHRADAGLTENMADYVIMNPPYWDDEKVRHSPNDDRVSAHILGEGGLTPWFKTASAILKKNGCVSIIFPAGRLDVLLDQMKGRFGGIEVYPLYKGDNEAASRVIVRGIKASRAGLKILPGLILHEEKTEGTTRREWTTRANAVLKGEASLFI
ncbi:MAG: methyltransferase [Hyphomicrobiales bacterium]